MVTDMDKTVAVSVHARMVQHVIMSLETAHVQQDGGEQIAMSHVSLCVYEYVNKLF